MIPPIVNKFVKLATISLYLLIPLECFIIIVSMYVGNNDEMYKSLIRLPLELLGIAACLYINGDLIRKDKNDNKPLKDSE